MEKKQTRRVFLKASSGIAVVAPYCAASVSGADAPRVRFGCVGMGEQGRKIMCGLLLEGALVPAICDPDEREMAAAIEAIEGHYHCVFIKEDYPGCDRYTDFRRLIERPDIDAVLVATPTQWRAPIALAALRAGKDIYLEAPLGMTVEQSRAIRDAVRRQGAVFSSGAAATRARRPVRYACELVRNGRIGRLRSIQVGCPGGRRSSASAPASVPTGFDYARWLGPAARRPYSPERCAADGWPHISDYCAGGAMSAQGVHYLDIAHWAMGQNAAPLRIEGRAEFPQEGLFDTPLSWDIKYEYPGDVRLRFTDVSKQPEGVRFEGTDGWLHVTKEGALSAHHESLLRSPIAPHEINLPTCVKNEYENFLTCVAARSPTIADADAAHRATTACLLADIAARRAGRPLRWNSQTERFDNDDMANRMLAGATRVS